MRQLPRQAPADADIAIVVDDLAEQVQGAQGIGVGIHRYAGKCGGRPHDTGLAQVRRSEMNNMDKFFQIKSLAI
jgi:hypothetical protein